MLIDRLKSDVDEITDADGANAFVENIGTIQHIFNSKIVARRLFQEKVTELGLVYNKDTKKYEDAPTEQKAE